MSCQRCPFCYQMLWPSQTIKYSCNLRAQILIKYFSLLSWCFPVSLIWTTRLKLIYLTRKFRRGIFFREGGILCFVWSSYKILFTGWSASFSCIFIEYQAGPHFLFLTRTLFTYWPYVILHH